jgi:hypothetical protein
VPLPVETVILEPSRKLSAALAGTHLLGCAVPWLLGMAPAAATAISLLVLAAGWLQVRRHGVRVAPDAERALSLRADGQVLVRTQDGRELDCRLEAIPLSATSWVMLRLRLPDGSWRTVHLADDACGPDAHRRVRVFLRWALQSDKQSPLPG